MDGTIGTIDWAGCEDCQYADGNGCHAADEVSEKHLGIDLESLTIMCKLWKKVAD